MDKTRKYENLQSEINEKDQSVSELTSTLEVARKEAALARRVQDTEWSKTVDDFRDFMMKFNPKVEGELSTIAIGTNSKSTFDYFMPEAPYSSADWYCLRDFSERAKLRPVPSGQPCKYHRSEREERSQAHRQRRIDGGFDLHAQMIGI